MMKHKWQWSFILISLLLLVALTNGCVTVVAPGEVARPAELLTYTDTTTGFSVSYPEDWERVPQNLLTAGESVAFWKFELGNGMPPYFSVAKRDLPPGTSLEAYFEQEKAILEANPGYTFVSQEAVVINGIPAIKHSCTLVHQVTPAKVEQILLVQGNSAWIITCMCAPGPFSAQAATFDAIINSFRLLQAAAPAPPAPPKAPVIPPTAPSGFLSHSDATNGFSVSYPRDWQELPAEAKTEDTVFGRRIIEAAGARSAVLMIEKWLIPYRQDVQAGYEEMKAVFEKQPGYLFISKEDLVIDGIPAIKYVFQRTYEGMPTTIAMVYLVQDTTAWLINFACAPADAFSRFQPTFDAIVGSFHLTPVTTAPPPTPPSPVPTPPTPSTQWVTIKEFAPDYGLGAIWGSSGSDIFVVGGKKVEQDVYYPLIVHYDGNTWTEMDLPGGLEWRPPLSGLYAVWGTGPDDVFAVGYEGLILHYDGTRWTQMDNPELHRYPSADSFVDVWGTSGSNVYATVGGRSTVYHCDGSEWREVEPTLVNDGKIPTNHLGAIWGSSPTDVFAVTGTYCLGHETESIYHYDGSRWTVMTTPAPHERLDDIWGSAWNDVFAVGEAHYDSDDYQGTILHYDGSKWTEMPCPAIHYNHLYAVWGTSGSNVFAGGWDIILHYDGSKWTRMTTDRDEKGRPGYGDYTIRGIWGSGPNDVYAVATEDGEKFIFHYSGR